MPGDEQILPQRPMKQLIHIHCGKPVISRPHTHFPESLTELYCENCNWIVNECNCEETEC